MGKKAQTIGYWYKLAAHYGLCLGPIDALLEVRAGDRTAWSGRQTASGTISIDAADLWGGEKSEGGIVGDLDVMMGEATQAANDYLAATFGPEQSGNRGKTTVVFKGGKWGAMNPYPKAPAFKCERILMGWDDDVVWYPETAAVPFGYASQIAQIISDITWIKTTDSPHTFTNPGDDASWSHDEDDYTTTPTDLKPNFPTGVGKTGLAWMQISAAEGVPEAFSIDVKVNYDDSGKVIGASGVGLGPATAPPDISAYPRSEGISVAVPRIDGPFDGYVCFACVDGRDIATGETLGSPSGHQMLISSMALIVKAAVMNPAHILYDSITSINGGQGEPTGLINEASFTAAADKLYAEGFGLCTELIDGNIEAFQQGICDVIGGNITQSRIDGQYYLDLIRDDYVFEDLLVVTEDDVVEYSEDQSEPPELVNQIIVEWFDPVTKQNRATAPIQALGAIQASGAVISETRTYREIPTEALALRVAKRDLKARSTPLKKFKLTTNRRLHALRPGVPFRLHMPSESIADMVCRTGSVDFGTLTDGRMRITAVQDVFAMPNTVYVDAEPGKWEPPSTVPADAPEQTAFEAPYVELAGRLTAADLAVLTDTAGFLVTAATRPDVGINYTLWTNADGEDGADRGTADWCQSALVVEAAALEDPLPTQFTLSGGSDLDTVDVGTAALWGDEIVRVDAIDADLLTVTLGRGCADTVPAAHAAGERIWFYDVAAGTDAREYADGETVHARLLTRTSSAQLDPVAATDNQVVMDGRQARPYPPAQFTINTETYPTSAFGLISVGAVDRDRLLQADQLFDTGEAAQGPEAGVTYTIRYYADDVLEHTVTGITTFPSTYTPVGDCALRIELEAVRDSLTSWQLHQHSLSYIAAEVDHYVNESVDAYVDASGNTYIGG